MKRIQFTFLVHVNTPSSQDNTSSSICPNSPNVLSRNFTDSNGNFKICRNNQRLHTHVLIKGSESQYFNHSEVCLFMGQQNGSNTPLNWIQEARQNRPLYRCGILSDNQVQISIPELPSGLTWNTAVIIQSADLSQMLTCISWRSASLCPHYSLGIIQ
jgi:hypothetical protein